VTSDGGEKTRRFGPLPDRSPGVVAVQTAETFLELMGARVRNPNTRSAYRVAWRSFLAFCSERQLELENVKAYHVGAWLDQHPGSRSTQRLHLPAVRMLFDSLMMRGVVEYNPAARARPPKLVRESSHTPVFEDAEIVAFLGLDKLGIAKRHSG
jgi:integrase/recombinase XerD